MANELTYEQLRQQALESERTWNARAASLSSAAVPGIDTNAFFPMGPSLSPMSTFFNSLGANVASAISGNPFYQQQEAQNQQQADLERRQTLRQRAEAALGEAHDQRAIALQRQQAELTNAYEMARTAGGQAATLDLADRAAKNATELAKLHEDAQKNLAILNNKAAMERQAASDAAAAARMRDEINARREVTGNPTLDAMLKIQNGRQQLLGNARIAWADAVKNKSSKAKTIDQFIAQNPEYKRQLDLYDNISAESFAKTANDPNQFVQMMSGVLGPEKTAAMVKQHWPNAKIETAEPAKPTAAVAPFPTTNAEMINRINSDMLRMGISPFSPFWQAGQVPGAIQSWFNAPPSEPSAPPTPLPPTGWPFPRGGIGAF